MKAGDTIVVATKNTGKVREFAHALSKLGVNVVSMFDYPDVPDIIEDGETFMENARKKARTAAEALGLPALADDSGLEVAALAGRPGIYSARYSGPDATDERNNAKLLSELKQLTEGRQDEPERLPDGTALLSDARFVCALALYDPETGTFTEAEGEVPGRIADRPRGSEGFGYDPLFWLPELGKSMAELTKDVKQSIGHRGAALRALLERLDRETA
ncbi:RdgB/HAM1 family non-canonical purine NTP pyrophosphatase [Paenibacillus humicola]|uniref:RdgB/HAM1 family non-canonical purine NTP pyrophosphatase n=1 Tax=Paenibacillus humicola TaxID=3110540 RepID=UPI00237BEF9B|nr:RdgB/HAM1 family non-canonical purine NTP pyrophosphatase [Paenibacillus humicola]